jgi:hypothetical protein
MQPLGQMKISDTLCIIHNTCTCGLIHTHIYMWSNAIETLIRQIKGRK